MPAERIPGTAIEAFARDVDALIDHYAPLLDLADIALVLASNLTPLVAAHCEPSIVDALKVHYDVALKKRMAKASLEGGE